MVYYAYNMTMLDSSTKWPLFRSG